jgi:hypothetical protein
MIGSGTCYADLNSNRHWPLTGSDDRKCRVYEPTSFNCYGALRYWQCVWPFAFKRDRPHGYPLRYLRLRDSLNYAPLVVKG